MIIKIDHEEKSVSLWNRTLVIAPTEALILLEELRGHEAELQALAVEIEDKPLAVGDNVRVNFDVPPYGGHIGYIISIDKDTSTYMVHLKHFNLTMGYDEDMIHRMITWN